MSLKQDIKTHIRTPPSKNFSASGLHSLLKHPCFSKVSGCFLDSVLRSGVSRVTQPKPSFQDSIEFEIYILGSRVLPLLQKRMCSFPPPHTWQFSSSTKPSQKPIPPQPRASRQGHENFLFLLQLHIYEGRIGTKAPQKLGKGGAGVSIQHI